MDKEFVLEVTQSSKNFLQEINTLIINFLVEKVLKSLVSSMKSKVFGLASFNFSHSEHMGIFLKHQSSWSFQKKNNFFLSEATYTVGKGIYTAGKTAALISEGDGNS